MAFHRLCGLGGGLAVGAVGFLLPCADAPPTCPHEGGLMWWRRCQLALSLCFGAAVRGLASLHLSLRSPLPAWKAICTCSALPAKVLLAASAPPVHRWRQRDTCTPLPCRLPSLVSLPAPRRRFREETCPAVQTFWVNSLAWSPDRSLWGEKTAGRQRGGHTRCGCASWSPPHGHRAPLSTEFSGGLACASFKKLA